MTKELKTIGTYGNNSQGRKKFMAELLEAGKEGWVLPLEDFNVVAKLSWGACLRVTLVKPSETSLEGDVGVDNSTLENEDSESVDAEVDISTLDGEDKIKAIEDAILRADKLKKDDMLSYASHYKIEIPDDIKLPLQIRKYLKDAIDLRKLGE